MDFSAFNPLSTNSLNIAARNNDVVTLERLLKKNNPNCVDNRGWTCLHEAASNDSYECLKLILKHPNCRPLSETYEGHTPLYLACRKRCSIETIKTLLDNVDCIANYASTEMVTPLHIVSSQGRLEVLQLLLEYGAIVDVQDFDGDTPLHDAAFSVNHDAVSILLHAGADADKPNEAYYTPFHLACCKGCLETVTELYPFVTDLNRSTRNGETPLMLAAQIGGIAVVNYLLDKGADPHVRDDEGNMALNFAMFHGNSEVFKILLAVTDADIINKDIILLACKPHFFNMDMIIALLQSELGPEFFNITEDMVVSLEKIGIYEPSYGKCAPLNAFLSICEYIYSQMPELFIELFYLYLMRGVAVNALYIEECPPLVYIHYCENTNCFEEVLRILLEHGCNVDYKSGLNIPDALIASLTAGGTTLPHLLPYSLAGEPDDILHFILEVDIFTRISVHVQEKLLLMIDNNCSTNLENLRSYVPSLKHLSRLKVRNKLKRPGISTKQFLEILTSLQLPPLLQGYLRYT